MKRCPIIVSLYIEKYCSIAEKLRQLTLQNYPYLKFPPANLKTFSVVLVEKILLEKAMYDTLYLFLVVLLSFSDIISLSFSNEAILPRAILLLFYFHVLLTRCQRMLHGKHTFVMCSRHHHHHPIFFF